MDGTSPVMFQKYPKMKDKKKKRSMLELLPGVQVAGSHPPPSPTETPGPSQTIPEPSPAQMEQGATCTVGRDYLGVPDLEAAVTESVQVAGFDFLCIPLVRLPSFLPSIRSSIHLHDSIRP